MVFRKGRETVQVEKDNIKMLGPSTFPVYERDIIKTNNQITIKKNCFVKLDCTQWIAQLMLYWARIIDKTEQNYKYW